MAETIEIVLRAPSTPTAGAAGTAAPPPAPSRLPPPTSTPPTWATAPAGRPPFPAPGTPPAPVPIKHLIGPGGAPIAVIQPSQITYPVQPAGPPLPWAQMVAPRTPPPGMEQMMG